jgi:hypothetical protein
MADGGNEKLLLEAVPLDDAGEYEIPDARPLEQLETYVPSCSSCRSSCSDISGLQIPNIRYLAQLVASDPTFTTVATAPSTPGKAAPPGEIPEVPLPTKAT